MSAFGQDCRNYTDLLNFSVGSVYFPKICPPFQRNVFTDMFWILLLWKAGRRVEKMDGWMGEGEEARLVFLHVNLTSEL